MSPIQLCICIIPAEVAAVVEQSWGDDELITMYEDIIPLYCWLMLTSAMEHDQTQDWFQPQRLSASLYCWHECGLAAAHIHPHSTTHLSYGNLAAAAWTSAGLSVKV